LWKKKILKLGDKILGEHPGSFAPSTNPLIVNYGENIPNYAGGRTIRRGPPNLAGKKRLLKATALLGPNDIPSIIIEEPEDNRPKEGPGKSYSRGDDLVYQQRPLPVTKNISFPAPMSQLDTLPSQLHPLRQNPPGGAIQGQCSLQRRPNPSTTYEVEGQTARKQETATAYKQKLARKPLPPPPKENYVIELPADNAHQTRSNRVLSNEQLLHQKPLPVTTAQLSFAEHVATRGTTYMRPLAASSSSCFPEPRFRQLPLASNPLTAPPVFATTEIDGKAFPPKANPHTRAPDQAEEHFLSGGFNKGQYDPNTLNTLQGGSTYNPRAFKDVSRTPTILRPGQQKSSECVPNTKLFSEETPRPFRPMTLFPPQAHPRFSYHFSAEAPVARAPNVLRPGYPESRYVPRTVDRTRAYFDPYPAPTPPDQKMEFDLELPKLPYLQPLSLSMQWQPKRGQEPRISSRISRPGLHDAYAASPKLPPPGLSTVSAKAKEGNGMPEPQCAWDQIILKACASIESISTSRSYARKAV
jgi:hypothetical protein